MAARSFSIKKIHCIVVNAPDDGDDSFMKWEEESEEEISDPHEAEELENRDPADNYGNKKSPLTSENCEQTQNHDWRVRKHQKVTEVNWGELDEVFDVAYPECLRLSFKL